MLNSCNFHHFRTVFDASCIYEIHNFARVYFVNRKTKSSITEIPLFIHFQNKQKEIFLMLPLGIMKNFADCYNYIFMRTKIWVEKAISKLLLFFSHINALFELLLQKQFLPTEHSFPAKNVSSIRLIMKFNCWGRVCVYIYVRIPFQFGVILCVLSTNQCTI